MGAEALIDTFVDIVVEESAEGFSVVLKADGEEIERTQPMPRSFAYAMAETLGERCQELGGLPRGYLQ